MHVNIYSLAKRLKEKGVQIFAVGQKTPNYGWMKAKDELNLKEIASTTGHYACLDQWFTITELVPSIMPDAKGRFLFHFLSFLVNSL